VAGRKAAGIPQIDDNRGGLRRVLLLGGPDLVECGLRANENRAGREHPLLGRVGRLHLDHRLIQSRFSQLDVAGGLAHRDGARERDAILQILGQPRRHIRSLLESRQRISAAGLLGVFTEGAHLLIHVGDVVQPGIPEAPRLHPRHKATGFHPMLAAHPFRRYLGGKVHLIAGQRIIECHLLSEVGIHCLLSNLF